MPLKNLAPVKKISYTIYLCVWVHVWVSFI